ncbi:MAG: hypothetical protein ABI416_11170 [Ginsengibacter sp.]
MKTRISIAYILCFLAIPALSFGLPDPLKIPGCTCCKKTRINIPVASTKKSVAAVKKHVPFDTLVAPKEIKPVTRVPVDTLSPVFQDRSWHAVEFFQHI